MAANNYVDHSEEVRQRLQIGVRQALLGLITRRVEKIKDYKGLSAMEKAEKYIRQIMRPFESSDRTLIDFLKGNGRRIPASSLSALMMGLDCSVSDIFPSIEPSRDRVPQGAECFSGIGSYWDAYNLVIV